VKLTPRGKLLALVAIFLAPIAASFIAYYSLDLKATGNYGELIVPPGTLPGHRYTRPDGAPFAFAEVAGKWVLVTSDSGECGASCLEKLTVLRQVRLALGRNASRVERVFVVDDVKAPDATALEAFPGLRVAVTPRGLTAAPGVGNDRAHIYLADPHGNVMMRWPAAPDARRMLKDLERLLKASQIG
jgi:cytochrome oxidase Cu insertion factor (SCO1/SenC/PrrC family)